MHAMLTNSSYKQMSDQNHGPHLTYQKKGNKTIAIPCTASDSDPNRCDLGILEADLLCISVDTELSGVAPFERTFLCPFLLRTLASQ